MRISRTAPRRRFLQLAATMGTVLFSASALRTAERKEEGDVSPAEDLMREHGILKRILLIYEEAIRRIERREELPLEAIADSARIIRSFIEDYHEKLEEDFLFPRFEKAKRLTDLVKILREQHDAGRRLTSETLSLAREGRSQGEAGRAALAVALRQFVRMYAPHEAREDTVLFPALHEIISRHEYDALGEDFEMKEHALFGEEGFEKMVERVAGIEMTLGIYELAQFTPR